MSIIPALSNLLSVSSLLVATLNAYQELNPTFNLLHIDKESTITILSHWDP